MGTKRENSSSHIYIKTKQENSNLGTEKLDAHCS